MKACGDKDGPFDRCRHAIAEVRSGGKIVFWCQVDGKYIESRHVTQSWKGVVCRNDKQRG